MNNPTQKPNLLRRVGGILKSCFLYLWIGKTAYLGFWTTDYYSYGWLAASFLAIRDGLLTMPETLVTVISASFSFLAKMNSELTHQLGYAPFTSGGGNYAVSGMFWLILFCVAVLSIVQFAIWMVLKKRGVRILWRAPCVPDIYQGKMKLAYWAICWLVIAALCSFSFSYGVVTSIVTALFLILTMRFPLPAGTFFWLLDVTSSRRGRRFDRSSNGFWRWFQNLWAGTCPHSAHEDYGPHGAGYQEERKDQQSRQNGGPVIDRLSEAHATFDLTPDTITREKLKSKYRTLMKKLHPDSDGSGRLASILNSNYETLLTYYSWKR